MNDEQIKTIEEIINFLTSNQQIEYKFSNKKEAYSWIEHSLIRFKYLRQTKTNKGVIKQYIEAISAYSRAQITRLIKQYVKTGYIKIKVQTRPKFQTKYSETDIKLLAETDMIHNNPNGHTLKVILSRMAETYCDCRFSNIKDISVAHIYNLRETSIYKRINKHYTKTKPTIQNSIAVRQKPKPDGKPGFIRVDTVHQGDKNNEKGVYHINMVDEVTQFQFIAATPVISEFYLIPILEKLLLSFPFKITEFHSDNGSEFINYKVVAMLNKLHIKQTKSRSRQTNDNALVEGKNGSIIRKWIGYGFIPKTCAAQLNQFYSVFNVYLNFHRPCAFAEIKTDKKGKTRKFYPHNMYKTPFEKLKSLTNYTSYLKSNVSPVLLESLALQSTDNEMALNVQKQLLNILKEEEDISPDYVKALSIAF